MRVNRDELVEFQVDGTEGSAVAGLRSCRVQHRSATPKPVWNPDLPATESFRDQWQEVPDNAEFDNGFKAQWELFLRHVALDAPYHWDLLAGARGVQLAELGLTLLGGGPPLLRRAGDRRCEGRSGCPTGDGCARTRRGPSPPPPSAARPAAPRSPPVRSSRPRTSSPTRTPTPRPDVARRAVDWDATLAFRRHLWSHGLGVAEAMDTAQRGMGLDWAGAAELIRRSAAEAKAVRRPYRLRRRAPTN